MHEEMKKYFRGLESWHWYDGDAGYYSVYLKTAPDKLSPKYYSILDVVKSREDDFDFWVEDIWEYGNGKVQIQYNSEMRWEYDRRQYGMSEYEMSEIRRKERGEPFSMFDHDLEEDVEDSREYQEAYNEWWAEKKKDVEKALKNAQSVLPEFKVWVIDDDGDKGRVYFGVSKK